MVVASSQVVAMNEDKLSLFVVVSSSTNSIRSNIYPALISSVADTFTQRVFAIGHEGENEFTGKDVVDELLIILKSVDRLLARTLAQSLLDQKLFIANSTISTFQDDVTAFYHLSSGSGSPIAVSGVYTKLTKCFSPTCSDASTCYSSSCPQRKLNHVHLRREILGPAPRSPMLTVLGADPVVVQTETRTGDANVSPEVLDTLSDDEKKRQSFIRELVSSELDFAQDLLRIREVLPLGLFSFHL